MKEKDLERIADLIAFGTIPEGWEKELLRLGWKNGDDFVPDIDVQAIVRDHMCAICGDGPDPDIRTLYISCFYQLGEVSNKFTKQEDGSYTLRFCKPCRGHFMFDILGPWLNSKGHKEHPNWNGEATVQYV